MAVVVVVVVFTVVLCNHTSIDTYKRSAALLAF